MFRYFYFIMNVFALTVASFSIEAEELNYDYASIFVEKKNHIAFERLRELTILKAAKIAQSRGYTHFEFMYSKDRAVVGSVEKQGGIVRDVYGNASQASQTTNIFPTPIRSDATVIVKFCNDSETSCRGISAKEAIRNLHPWISSNITHPIANYEAWNIFD